MSGFKMNDSFFLTKNNHEDSVKTIFQSLLRDGEFTDVTLALSDDKQIRGHRAILAASSSYFREIFQQNSASGLFLEGVNSVNMNSIMEFIYLGHTSVNKTDITTFLQTAEHLRIEGLIQPGVAPISDMKEAFESLPEPVHRSDVEISDNIQNSDDDDFNGIEERIRPSCSLGQKIFESHDDKAGDKEGVDKVDENEESLVLKDPLESSLKDGTDDVKTSDDDLNESEERIRPSCSQGQKIVKSDEDKPGYKEEDEEEFLMSFVEEESLDLERTCHEETSGEDNQERSLESEDLSRTSEIDEEDAVYIDGKVHKGKQTRLLYFKGESYHKEGLDKNNPATVYYKCKHFKSKGCKARAIVTGSRVSTKPTSSDHNHRTDNMKEKISWICNKKIGENLGNDVKPSILWKQIQESILGEASLGKIGLSLMQQFDSWSRKLNYQRQNLKGHRPKTVPRKAEDVEVPEKFRTTPDNKRFLLMDEKTKNNKRIIGFASKSGLKALHEADTWYADGCMSTMKQMPLQQLWVIFVTLPNRTSVPCAYYMMEDKSALSYEMIFDALKNRGVQPPKVLMIDFEDDVMKATKSALETVQLSLCNVHYKRTLEKKMRKLGLWREDREDIKVFLRRLWILSVIPPDSVVAIYDGYIKSSMPLLDKNDEKSKQDNVKLVEFEEYYEETFVGLNVILPGSRGIASRGEPRFPIKSWNQYHQVQKLDDINTNKAEAWNSKLIYGNYRGNIYRLMEAIQKEEADARAKIDTSLAGLREPDQSSKRIKGIRSKREELKAVLENFDKDQEGALELLAAYYGTEFLID